MSTISKVFTVVNLVLALFLLGSVAGILAESADYKKQFEKEKVDRKADVDRLASEKADLESRKNNSDTEASNLRNQKSQLEDDKQSLTAERDTLRNDNNQLRSSVDGINGTLANLQRQLADVEARNKALTEKNDEFRTRTADAEKAKMEAEEDRARIDGDKAQMAETIAENERQLAQLSGARDNLLAEREALVAAGVDVTKIIGGTVPLIEGTISAVGPGFVVLSVGEHDGVKVGYPFDIFRGGDYIGRVVVNEVLPDNCTATVQIQNTRGLEFKTADNARTRL